MTVLNVQSGRSVAPPLKHSANLGWFEWSPDSSSLLAAGAQDMLVWDAQTGAQRFGTLHLPDGDIRTAHWSPDGRFIVARNTARRVRVWDAATGEPATPPLEQAGQLRAAFFTRSNHLVTVSDPDLLRVWSLAETKLPADVIADYAKFLAGRQLNAAGVMLPLKPDELAALRRSLAIRAPELFP